MPLVPADDAPAEDDLPEAELAEAMPAEAAADEAVARLPSLPPKEQRRPVARMQTAIATAFKVPEEWKEF